MGKAGSLTADERGWTQMGKFPDGMPGALGKFGVCLDEARLALIAGFFALIGGLGRPFRAVFMWGANPGRCPGLVWGRAVGARYGGLLFHCLP